LSTDSQYHMYASETHNGKPSY